LDKTDPFAVRTALQQALSNLDGNESTSGQLVTLPVYYSEESGPDLNVVAKLRNISIEDVIEIHQQQEYRVYAIGFAPGFAYLGEVDERIAAPRLSTPRQKVPRGAVAIADRQTAVYPAQSPGGWNLIGLCPTRMFNPELQPSMPVQVGDRIRFKAIERDEFLQLGGEL
jgi:KipI family sensor histidine kinase inhibitor